MDCEHPPVCPSTCSHCQAFDKVTKTLCSAVASSGSKWCAVHEEIQAKLLKTYKRSSLAVEAFDDSLIPSTSDLNSVNDLSLLKKFSADTRLKWSLTFRASLARASHHDQFYQGGDESHCFFVDSLKEESNRLEILLRTLDQRAYAITLADSEAEWILTPSPISFICNDEPSTTTRTNALLTPPPTPTLLSKQLPATSPISSLTNKNQRKKAQRKNRKLEDEGVDLCCPASTISIETPDTAELLSRLRNYLIPPMTLPTNIRHSTWYSTVANLFRHVILRIPSLALLALDSTGEGDEVSTFSTVESFLDFLERRSCCVVEVERLYTSLNFAKTWAEEEGNGSRLLGVGVLRDAIAEVYRVRNEDDELPGKFVQVLGGRVYKEPNEDEMPDEFWDLFYQFIGCYGCSLSVTRSFTSYSRNRRLALLGSYPDWMDQSEDKPDNILRCAGMIGLSHNASTCGKKIKRVVQKASKGKAVVVETWERPWTYFNMPLGHSSIAILEDLVSMSTRFEILARNLSTGEVLYAPTTGTRSCDVRNCECCSPTDLWLSKVRSGTTPEIRKGNKWSTSTFLPSSTVLDSLKKCSSTEGRFDRTSTDLIEVLIMDNLGYAGSCIYSEFLTSIAVIITRARRGKSLMEEKSEARNKGEIMISLETGGEEKIMRKMFRD